MPVLLEARRQCEMPLNLIRKQPWDTTWVLGTKPWSSVRATSNLNQLMKTLLLSTTIDNEGAVIWWLKPHLGRTTGNSFWGGNSRQHFEAGRASITKRCRWKQRNGKLTSSLYFIHTPQPGTRSVSVARGNPEWCWRRRRGCTGKPDQK